MRNRYLSCFVWIAAALLLDGIVSELAARGFRGGGGRAVARPSVSRPAPRPASRPSTRPSTRPSGLSGGSTRPSRLPDRSPAISPSRPTTRPAGTRNSIRPRPVSAVPGRSPLPASFRSGTPATRQVAARTRSREAFARARPAATTASRNRIARRSAQATMARAALRPYSSRVFTPNWWNARRNLWNHRWHYCHRHPWWWWWSRPRWGSVVIWVDNDWDDPWVYEYDDNVVFEEDAVFINDAPVAAAEDYVEGAEELSQVPPLAEDAEVEWTPLGVFAMATSPEDRSPNMMVQFVLAKDGRVGGDYYHIKTDSSRAIHGSLDVETQRIAFKIGEKSRNVLEVGLESLMRDEAPVWVHFENGKRTQTWTLIRLEEPEEAKAERAKAGATGGQ